MKATVVLSVFILFFSNFYSVDGSDDCEYELYHKCRQATTFTDEEVENVRLFLQQKFSKTHPIGEPCKRLHVRRDIKCLSDEEFGDFVAVVKQMYESGFMDRMTAIHHGIWPMVHKYDMGNPWHRWFVMVFEKEMLRINPKVTLPYWDHFIEFAEPHKSKMWDLFGHAGTAANDYCVSDGPFANMTFKVPSPHCLRRQFKPDGTMNLWEGPEWATAYHQMGVDPRLSIKGMLMLANLTTPDAIPRTLKTVKNVVKTLSPVTSIWSQFALANAIVGHFKTHLSIGGFNGDMSESFAPNDIVFYVFHCFLSDLSLWKWQLMNDRNLVPENYNLGVKYNFQLMRSEIADINRDILPVFDVPIKESFQLGYGELCYVYDQLIKPINQLIKGKYSPLPVAAKRLRAVLPKKLFDVYYPKFALYPNKVTIFDHLMPDIPDHCNVACRSTPVAHNFKDTPEGLRVLDHYKNDLGLDLTPSVTEWENSYLRLMGFVNQYQYCSPYVS